MKRILLILASVTLLTACGKFLMEKSNPVQPMPKASHKLVERDLPKSHPDIIWEDRFYDLDPSIWNIQTEKAWKPMKRKQYYLPRNVTVQNGILSITVKKENHRGDPYTSGAITTLDKREIKYGRLEIRAKLPNGKGLLPAIWLLPVSGKEFPEIDIAEMIGQEPHTLWNVLHWKEGGSYHRDYTHTNFSTALTNDFHVYGIIWTKEKLTYTLNGKTLFTSTVHVPDVPMYLYINVTVGGVWATDPLPFQTFPKVMQVDYVKYYKN